MKLIPVPLLLLLKAIVGDGAPGADPDPRPVRGSDGTRRAKIAPGALIGGVALYFAAHAVNAAKLRVFLPALTFPQALRFTCIALFYGAVLPSQLAGDAVKAVRIVRALGGGNIGEVAAAIALDKAVSLFALLVLTCARPRARSRTTQSNGGACCRGGCCRRHRRPARADVFGAAHMAGRVGPLVPGLARRQCLRRDDV